MSNPTPRRASPRQRFASAEKAAPESGKAKPDGAGETLEDTAREEREYLRDKLRDELGREPTEEEADEWLRQHTEGY
ncbi:MAG TPA: hypothetical protein VM870_03725 [Pyrinomonadaceae bacterium]|nr:hypothetical protein [Pyrinomonadaceae bacterium]